jgi:hypothetical protein
LHENTTQDEIREVIQDAQKDRIIVKRAQSTPKKARCMVAEAGFKLTGWSATQITIISKLKATSKATI